MTVFERFLLYLGLVLNILVIVLLFKASAKPEIEAKVLEIKYQAVNGEKTSVKIDSKDLEALEKVLSDSNMKEADFREAIGYQQNFYLGIVGILSLLIAGVAIASIARSVAASELQSKLVNLRKDLTDVIDISKKSNAYLDIRLEILDLYSNKDEVVLVYGNDDEKEVESSTTYLEYIEDRIPRLFSEIRLDDTNKKINFAHDFVLGIDKYAREIGFIERNSPYDIGRNEPLKYAISSMRIILGKEAMDKVSAGLRTTFQDKISRNSEIMGPINIGIS